MGFSSSLSDYLGSEDDFLVYVSEGMDPSITTSSIDLLNAQFTSSVTNSFSSSMAFYINEATHSVEETTYQSVSSSISQSFVSSFYSSLSANESLIISQSFGYENSDINMDITPIVKAWMLGSIPNEGIILISSEELSLNPNTNSHLGYYSKETNTIYSPHLDVIWDDSSFNSSNLQPITSDVPFNIVIKNVKKEYKSNSIVRINIFARDKFALKNFIKATQQSSHLTSKYLPEETYYSIKDTETEEVIVDFDEGTKLSCDSTGNYFLLDMSGLPQERYFKILIKTEIDGGIDVIDNNTYFKVVR
jgi:hypothetical protein